MRVSPRLTLATGNAFLIMKGKRRYNAVTGQERTILRDGWSNEAFAAGLAKLPSAQFVGVVLKGFDPNVSTRQRCDVDLVDEIECRPHRDFASPHWKQRSDRLTWLYPRRHGKAGDFVGIIELRRLAYMRAALEGRAKRLDCEICGDGFLVVLRYAPRADAWNMTLHLRHPAWIHAAPATEQSPSNPTEFTAHD